MPQPESRMKTNRAIQALPARILALAAMLYCQHEAFAIYNMKVGDPMPEFDLPRADSGFGSIKSRALVGKPSTIIFWRPGQELSIDALRELETVVEDLGADRVNTVAVDVSRSTVEAIQSIFEDQPLSYPVLLDPDRALYGAVGVIVAPTTLMFDAKGELQFIAPSFPAQYGRVARARLRFLLGEIDVEEMNKRIEPAILKIEHEQALAWRKYNLGRRLEEDGKIEHAAGLYEEAVGHYPQLAEAQSALGFLKIAQGEVLVAASNFQAALRYQPRFNQALLGKAAVLGRLGHVQESEKILLQLISDESIAVRANYELGRLYRSQGQLGKALEAYEQALAALFPEPGTEVPAEGQ